MALATQPISPTDITQRIATWTNAVRLDVARLRLVTAFLPAPQELEHPTVARMTPAKTVSPPAQAFLVPDAAPAVAGRLVVGADVSAADGEVIGCFSFALSDRRRTAAGPQLNRWWRVDVMSARGRENR
jgi:hypothetical protein